MLSYDDLMLEKYFDNNLLVPIFFVLIVDDFLKI
jgi:hypothetical protein